MTDYSKHLELISAQARVNGMYDILNDVLTPGTKEYNEAKKLIDEQWKIIDKLRAELGII